MPIYIGNDTRFDSDPLTDAAGVAITTGTVNLSVEKNDALRSETYITAGAMTHIAGGVWRLDVDAAVLVAGIPTDVQKVVVRIDIPGDARWERVVEYIPRTP